MKHSKLAITALVIFLSPVVPLTIMFCFINGILPKLHSYEQVSLLGSLFLNWYVFAPITACILSIIDLLNPGRSKVIPAVILIICTIITVVATFIITWQDINRLVAN